MGIIFQVRDKSLDRQSAMKVALPAILREPTYAALFVGEPGTGKTLCASAT